MSPPQSSLRGPQELYSFFESLLFLPFRSAKFSPALGTRVCLPGISPSLFLWLCAPIPEAPVYHPSLPEPPLSRLLPKHHTTESCVPLRNLTLLHMAFLVFCFVFFPCPLLESQFSSKPQSFVPGWTLLLLHHCCSLSPARVLWIEMSTGAATSQTLFMT